MDTTNYDLIYEIIILIFFIIAFITSLYMIYLKSKAWHKLNLESRKEVAASTVEFVAKPGIEREVVMINASRFIAAIVLLLSWAFFYIRSCYSIYRKFDFHCCRVSRNVYERRFN